MIKLIFIAQLIKQYPENIRSLHLSSHDFISQDGDESNNALADFDLISSFIYESTKFEEHLAISIDDADSLPQSMLDDIAKLGEHVNLQKNKVSFLLAGSPNLLSKIDKISNIRKLGIAHCTLDEMVLEDLVDFIESRQLDIPVENRINFNANALKTINTHASGNMLKASVLLEWCREYASFSNENLINANHVKKLLKILSNKTHEDGINQFITYPDGSHDFLEDGLAPTTEKTTTARRRTASTISNSKIPTKRDIQNTSPPKIVQVNKKLTTTEMPKIFERVMRDRFEDNTSHDETQSIESDLAPAQSTIVENIVMQESDHVSKSFTNEFNTEDSNNNSSETGEDYQPIYIENTDLSLTRLQSKESRLKKQISPIQWTLILTISLALLFYISLMLFQHYSANKHIYNAETGLAAVSSDLNDETRSGPASNSSTTNDQDSSLTPDISSTIQALLKLADVQMQANKLTTPEGDNAFSTYTTILSLDSENAHATEGIKDIQNTYTIWADRQLDAGNILRAKQLLEKAAYVAPNDTKLAQRIEDLN